MPTAKQVEHALALIQAVRSSLDKGYKHYKLDGTPLDTELEVIRALKDDGEVNVTVPAGIDASEYDDLPIGRVLKAN
jgi:hypothetical protein